MESDSQARRWDPRNFLLLVIAPVAFFALLEGALALFGVEPVLYEEDPYVGFAGSIPLFVEATRPDGTVWLTTAPNKRRLFNAQSFPRQKGSGVFRIFCLGGSTTHGRPYDDGTSFCGWLRELLPAVEPDRSWEVINAGGVSYASYRVALLMEELVAYEPDLFVIYSGHNEFLEERTYSGIIETPPAVRGLAALASRTRVWAAMRSGLRRLRRTSTTAEETAGTAAARAAPRLSPEVRTRLDASIGPDAYERDDELRRQVLAHFRFNLARMVDIGRSAGATTLFVVPASNLRHATPFKSEHRSDLDGEELAAWERASERATAALGAGEPAVAEEALAEATRLDPRHAHTLFRYGGALYELGRFAAARRAFESARDEDVCPLRALGAMEEIVRRVAEERGVPWIDFAGRVAAAAPHGIAGEEQFFDHVHPRIEVHRNLALALLERMRAEGMLRASARWSEATVAAVTARVLARIDPATHGQALVNLSKVLGWAGKLEEARRLAETAVATAPTLAEAHYQAGLTAQLLGDDEVAIEHYRATLRLTPDAVTAHGNLAAALEARGSTLQAIRHYRRAIELLGDGGGDYRRQLEATLRELGATPD